MSSGLCRRLWTSLPTTFINEERLSESTVSLLRIFQIFNSTYKQMLRCTFSYVAMNFTAVDPNNHFTQVEVMKYGLR